MGGRCHGEYVGRGLGKENVPTKNLPNLRMPAYGYQGTITVPEFLIISPLKPAIAFLTYHFCLLAMT